jgi:hypothetical protein
VKLLHLTDRMIMDGTKEVGKKMNQNPNRIKFRSSSGIGFIQLSAKFVHDLNTTFPPEYAGTGRKLRVISGIMLPHK